MDGALAVGEPGRRDAEPVARRKLGLRGRGATDGGGHGFGNHASESRGNGAAAVEFLLDDEPQPLIPHDGFRREIRPGITALALVSGFRGPTGTFDKLEGRIDRWSLWLDLRTIVRGFVHRNAL